MYEVEIKVRAAHDRIEDRLADRDTRALGTVTQVDTYYDAPTRDFAETDEALRVRRQTDGDDKQVLLTYKGPLVDTASKTREEAETQVESEADMRSILDGLGYEPAATVRKERAMYGYEGCTVTLDTIDGLGEFVEVEVTDDAVEYDDIDEARKSAIAVLESLGLDSDEQIQTSYLGLLLASESSGTAD